MLYPPGKSTGPLEPENQKICPSSGKERPDLRPRIVSHPSRERKFCEANGARRIEFGDARITVTLLARQRLSYKLLTRIYLDFIPKFQHLCRRDSGATCSRNDAVRCE